MGVACRVPLILYPLKLDEWLDASIASKPDFTSGVLEHRVRNVPPADSQ